MVVLMHCGTTSTGGRGGCGGRGGPSEDGLGGTAAREGARARAKVVVRKRRGRRPKGGSILE